MSSTSISNAKSINIDQQTTPGKGQKIGQILIAEGIINESDLNAALEISLQTNQHLGTVLMRQNKLTKEQLGKSLSKQFNMPYISLADERKNIPQEIVEMLPEEFIKDHRVFPVKREGNNLIVAMVDPSSRRTLDEITFITGLRTKAFVTTALEFQEALSGGVEEDSSSGLMAEMSMASLKLDNLTDETIANNADKDLSANSPLIKLVNAIIEEGIAKGASDIHLEPRKECMQVRFRVNGLLKTVIQVPKNMQASVLTRLKVMAKIDIAEHRRPQDGRFSMIYQDAEYNFRVNTLPTNEGNEKIVIRILRPSKKISDFRDLGMSDSDCKKMEQLYMSPYGIVLVCGPTGSGKTTTLYTVLHKINDNERNISTIEDPIELQIEGLNQCQVNHKADFVFSGALRALMRQDPDVIMVGEIRDGETLESAIHASLTGHLVFSTVHANTAAATISRLTEMGAEPALICTTVLGIVAQRLARQLCRNCKETYEATPEEKQIIFPGKPELQAREIKLHKPVGCFACGNSGYEGRLGLYEIMILDKKLRHLINAHALDIDIEDAAVEAGMKTLYMSAVEALLKGTSSFDELVRILGPSLGRTI